LAQALRAEHDRLPQRSHWRLRVGLTWRA